jgi:ABC-type cobalt transport system substrate-binding protein
MKRRREEEKGILPRIPKKAQKWLLIIAVVFGAFSILLVPLVPVALKEGLDAGEPASFVIAVIASVAYYVTNGALALYCGLRTKWLKNIEEAPPSVKITGRVAVVGIAIPLICSAAILAGYLAMLAIFIVIIGIVLLLVFSSGGLTAGGGGDAGEVIKETKKIEKEWFGDKLVLKDGSGIKVGEIEKAWFSNDQIIRDSDGREVARITQSLFNKDVQTIKDTEGNDVGEIRTDIWGKRVITDSSGNKIGEIRKNIWGETVIK